MVGNLSGMYNALGSKLSGRELTWYVQCPWVQSLDAGRYRESRRYELLTFRNLVKLTWTLILGGSEMWTSHDFLTSFD